MANSLRLGQFTIAGGRAVGDDLSRFDLLADLHDGPMGLAGSLVELAERLQLVLVCVVDDDPLGVDEGDGAAAAGLHQHAGELACRAFHSRCHQG